MPTLIATPGLPTSNSYETVVGADAYFDNRLPISPPWPGPTPDSGAQSLITATRTLDANMRMTKTKIEVDGVQYMVTSETWTGAPATVTQRLAWPRVGMFDGNGNSLDWEVTLTAGSPTIVMAEEEHRLTTGDEVFLFDSTSPLADGAHLVTVISKFIFTIPAAIGLDGFASMTIIPRELKEAISEFAGQLLSEDRTLDSDIAKMNLTQLTAGSISMSFGDGVEAQVIPDAVWNMMPPSWFTDEMTEGVISAFWGVV